jgi:hypothetical protein
MRSCVFPLDHPGLKRLAAFERKFAMRYPSSVSTPPGWRYWFWLALLVTASVTFTLGFACAVPFAAFGAIAAMTLKPRDALLLSTTVWLVNQVIGFTILHYPWDASALTWGAVLGAVAVLNTIAAQAVIRWRGRVGASLAGFAAAFIAYEGGLYLVSATWLGGTENFTVVIVTRILAINAAGFAGLLATSLLIAAAGRSGPVSLDPATTPIVSR